MIKQIKAHLNKSIQTVIGQKVEFVKQDEQAFTRQRSLSLETMIRTILGMGGEITVKRITRCQTDSFKFSLCSKTLSNKT